MTVIPKYVGQGRDHWPFLVFYKEENFMHESAMHERPQGGTLTHPELKVDPQRMDKAQAILASGAIRQIDETTWQVASQSGSGHHLVRRQGPQGLEDLECSCADFMGRNRPEIGIKAPCKHCVSVALGEGWISANGTLPNGDLAAAGEFDEEVEEEIGEVTSRLQADGLLWQVSHLEVEMEEIRNLAGAEIAQIKNWEEQEINRLQHHLNRLTTPLEAYLRHQDRKTLRLPHGEIKLRAQPPRIIIVDLATFPMERDELIRIVPEQRVPDKRKIKAHLEATGEIPPGVEVETQESRFSFSTSTHSPGKEIIADAESLLAEAAG